MDAAPTPIEDLASNYTETLPDERLQELEDRLMRAIAQVRQENWDESNAQLQRIVLLEEKVARLSIENVALRARVNELENARDADSGSDGEPMG